MPEGTRVVSTEGMTMMPGLFDMHVHLQILGHGDYERWNELYGDRLAEDVMPVAARQLLAAGVAPARDLGAPPEDILEVRRDPLRDMRAVRDVEVVVKDGQRVH